MTGVMLTFVACVAVVTNCFQLVSVGSPSCALDQTIWVGGPDVPPVLGCPGVPHAANQAVAVPLRPTPWITARLVVPIGYSFPSPSIALKAADVPRSGTPSTHPFRPSSQPVQVSPLADQAPTTSRRRHPSICKALVT